ncbi:MAG: hypothetical protein Q4B42_00915 [Oscillospiraceae bacterium]|nr:hypothetical protein [Oscillospiraceae bacterium]
MEDNPKYPDKVLIRFFENVEEFSEVVGTLTITGWKWDEYHLELEKYGDMAVDVFGNFDMFLSQAKQLDGSGNEDAWDALAAALNEGVNTIDE